MPAGGTETNPANNAATSTVPLVPSADVQLTKTGPSNATAGTNVDYTLTVTNAGPSTATGVSVTDPTPPGLTLVAVTDACTAFPCVLGNVAPATPQTVTVTYLVPAGYTTPDPIVNTASVTTTTADPNAANNTSTASTALAAPVTDLTISKTNGVTASVPGTPTTYTIVVGNAGPSVATNATVTDNFPAILAGVTWTCVGGGGATCPASGSGNISATVTVPVGGTATFTATGTIEPAAEGALGNTALATPGTGASDPTAATATDIDMLTPQADVAIVKSGPPSVLLGGNVAYTFLVTNNGPSTASEVVLGDATPAGLTRVSVTGDCTALPCSFATLLPAEVRTVTVTYTVPVAFVGRTIVNTATVATQTPDPVSANNSSTVETPVERRADLSITTTASPSVVNAGDQTTFTLTVGNLGPAPATGVVVVDQLPLGVTLVTATPAQGAFVASSGQWTVGTLAVGQSVTLTLLVNVTQSGIMTSVAGITRHDQPDPNRSNNSAVAVLNDADAADVAVRKTVDNSNPTGGQDVTFTITVSNNGPRAAADDVVVTDVLPAGLTQVSAVATQGTFAGSTWIVGTVTAGSPASLTIVATTNVATVLVNAAAKTGQNSAQADRNPFNDRSSVTLNGSASTNLAVVKIVDRPTAAVGETISFSVGVANLGPAVATGVTITDLLPVGLTLQSAATSAGAYDETTGEWTLGSVVSEGVDLLTLVARVDQAGTFVNTASVTETTTVDPDPVNDSGSATVVAVAAADFVVTKTMTSAAIPGLPVNDTIDVRNNGPSPVTGAMVTEQLPRHSPRRFGRVSVVPACATQRPGRGISRRRSIRTPGNSAIFTVTALVPSAALRLADERNRGGAPAGVTEIDPDQQREQRHRAATPQADVRVSKTGPAEAVAGTNINYSITVTNDGPSDAAGVTLVDGTPAGLTTYARLGHVSDVSLHARHDCGGQLGGPGACGHLLGVPPSYTTPDPIENVATISTTTPDPTPANNIAIARTSLAAPVADLSITKTNGVTTIVPGTTTTYTIVVSNAGPSDAIGSTVTDAFAADFSSVTWTCLGSGVGTCSAASGTGNINTTVNLPVGGSVTFTATGEVAPGAVGVIVNTASVAPPAGTADPSSASATDTDTLTPIADLVVTMTGSPAIALAGDALTYTITIANNGPSDAENVVLADSTPAGLEFESNAGDCETAFPCQFGVLPSGTTRTVTSIFRIPFGYTAPAPIVNTAAVVGTTTDNVLANNIATVTTGLNRDADVELTKAYPRRVCVSPTRSRCS